MTILHCYKCGKVVMRVSGQETTQRKGTRQICEECYQAQERSETDNLISELFGSFRIDRKLSKIDK